MYYKIIDENTGNGVFYYKEKFDINGNKTKETRHGDMLHHLSGLKRVMITEAEFKENSPSISRTTSREKQILIPGIKDGGKKRLYGVESSKL